MLRCWCCRQMGLDKCCLRLLLALCPHSVAATDVAFLFAVSKNVAAANVARCWLLLLAAFVAARVDFIFGILDCCWRYVGPTQSQGQKTQSKWLPRAATSLHLLPTCLALFLFIVIVTLSLSPLLFKGSFHWSDSHFSFIEFVFVHFCVFATIDEDDALTLLFTLHFLISILISWYFFLFLNHFVLLPMRKFLCTSYTHIHVCLCFVCVQSQSCLYT